MMLQVFLGLVFLSCFLLDANNAQSVGDCNFDRSMCLWKNAKGEDHFDWSRRKTKTSSIYTGPNKDHTNGFGYYLYIETSSPRRKGHVARLISPRMQGPQCMTLWYHMYGADMGHLAIYANNNGSLRLLWLKGGEQGHFWHKALINIQDTGEYKVEIDGVRGKSYRGDAAIDDITFDRGVCKEQAPPLLYAYADVVQHGRLHQQGLPSPGPRSLQYSLHLQREPFDKHDQFYLICQGAAGLRIIKTKHTPRKPFPCEPRNFFYSSNIIRNGLYPFFVIDRGSSTPQMVTLKNDTTYCSGPTSVTQLFATNINNSLNLAHNSTVSLSSSAPGFPATFATDGDHKTQEDNPWLEINLDVSRVIYKVYVTTRQNCSHGDKLPNLTVTIYEQNLQVSCQTTDQGAKEMSRVFLCQPPLRSHKLRVEHPGKQTQLSLCEVIINAIDSHEYLQGARAETWTSISSSKQLETFLKSPKRFDSPAISKRTFEFEDKDFGLNNYGQRFTAFVQPPENGKYKFYAMCDDQCKVWIKALKNFSDVSFFEDLEPEKQELFIFVTRYTGYRRWYKYPSQRRKKDLDSCQMYMLESVVKDGQGPGYIGVGVKTPSGKYSRPLTIPKMFWILPGLQMLNITLFEPSMKQSLLIVGQTMKVLISYRLCCHGIYCPSCTKSVRLQLLGHTFMVNSSLSNTCQWYNFTTSIVIINHPGKYNIKVLESSSNTSVTSHSIRNLDIKALVLMGCFYQDQTCPWTIKGNGGRTGWVAVQASDNIERHLEAETNTTAWLQSPTVQPQPFYRAIGLCLVFRYRSNHDSSQLHITANTLYNKTVLWHLKGMQGSQWNEARIPWPDNSVSQVQIQGKVDTNSSVAVSQIRLLTMKCSLTPNHATPGHTCKANEFQCHNGECVKSTLQCDGDYACVDKSDERSCACQSSEYECPDGKCLPVTHLCNGLKECADGSDEVNCGNSCKENQFSCLDGSCVPFDVTCDGVWNCKDGSDEPDICTSLRCPLNNVSCATTSVESKLSKECRTFRGPCNFEYGFCGLTTGGTNKSSRAKWQIKKGATPTSQTGPSIDHTTLTANGSYLYLEVSGLDRGDAAQLHSDWLEYDNVTCLQFWYHMWGRHVGALNVYVITNQTMSKVWSRTGDAGPKWRFGQTSIFSNGSSFKFVFEATAGNGSEGDIAIDDVDIITGKCDLSIFDLSSNCNFEHNYCNWKRNTGWVLQNSKHYTRRTDVRVRHKQSVGFARTNPKYVEVTPTLESPVIDPRKGFKCLRFWYFINSTGTIRLYSIDVSDGKRTPMWLSDRITNDWSFVQIPLKAQHKYQLSFETSRPIPEVTLVVAIDDITLSRDGCQNTTSRNENCKKRTTKGDCCVFPFVYQGRCYSYCIGKDESKLWCSLTDNYDRDGQKGFCGNIANTPLQVAPTLARCSIQTHTGKMCIFPFIYEKQTYYRCLTTKSKPWCGTTRNVDIYKDGRGYCDIKNLEQCGFCKQKTTAMGCCVFPFIYRSKAYFSCTTAGYDRYWCSLTDSYDKDKLYGICMGYETREDCRVSYAKQKPTVQWTPIVGSSSNATWSPRMPTSDARIKQDNVSNSDVYLHSGLFEMSFNGSTKGLGIINIPDLESFTACVWMKTNDTVHEGTPFRYRGTNIAGFGLFNYKNLAIRLMGKEKNVSMSANDGSWHHLCLVWTSKGGVYEMYKDGMFVIQGKDWHKNQKIPGTGLLRVGTDGFVGKISGMNLWAVAMSRSEIAQRALGCGIEGGDIVDWSSFSKEDNLIYPPSCLDAGGKGFNIIQNSTNPITGSSLISNVLNSSIADYSISFCLYFRFMLIGQSSASLKIYRSEMKDLNTNTSGEERVWAASYKISLPLWRFGAVSLSTTQTFKIRVSATLGPGQGTIGLAGYYTKPGYCPSFSEEEISGCHVDLTSKTGTFSTPYFPDQYPNDMNCNWRITLPNGYFIRLKFLSFELQDSQSCETDYVVVYDGASTSSNILGRYCGNSFPLLLESSSNSLVIVFNSDHEGSFSGFKMSYTSYIKEKEDCNFIENCPSSCTCSALPGNPPPVIVHCEGLTAIPVKIPVNTIAMMMSRNRLSRIEYSITSDLQYMDLSYNQIMSATPYSFIGLNNLTTLRLNYNFIKKLQPKVFLGMLKLEKLDLGNNLLGIVKDKSLDDLRNLQVLSLRSNQIIRIEKQSLKFVSNLTHLYLQNNLLEALPDGVFETLESLRVLYLNNNKLKKVSKDTFRNLRSLEELYLDKNHIQSIDETTFSHLKNLRLLKLDRFVFCCYAASSINDLTCISPLSAFSSCDDLMKNKTLQVCIWILGILAFVGNIGVIIWRLIVKERNRVHSFLLTNLAVSDLMMGVYLLIIAIKDLEWRSEYFKHDLQWRSSRVCQLAGALSVISSEVSVLILTTITADRYATIVFAFKFKRLKMKSAAFVVSLIWIFGFIIALFPILYSDYFYDNDSEVGFYGRSGVCLPLQLSQDLFPGWEYSVAIFIGLNFIAFTFILVAYIIMFWKVRSAGRSVRSTQMNTESAMARKMAFIIMTDFCCWMPIIIIGVLSLLGKFPDPEKLAYVWIAVFVLPVNSSINPVLYTFSNRSSCGKNNKSIQSFKSRVTHVVSRGLSRSNHVPLTNYPSVIFADASIATSMTAASEPHNTDILRDSSRKPKLNLVRANFFQGEFSQSVSFYQGFKEENEESMFLFKHFGDGERAEWNREVEVIDRLRKDGGHPNILKHLWYSPVTDAPVLIDLTNLESLQGHGFLICYDLVSCTILEEYLGLSKSEADLSTQILLAIATDVINALSYLERCDVRHNNVTAKNVLVKESFMVPSLQAVLGGFGQATFADVHRKTRDQKEDTSNSDIIQYGAFVEELLAHSPNADPDNQIKEISTRCLKESNTLTATAVRNMMEEVWDGTGTWDTLL